MHLLAVLGLATDSDRGPVAEGAAAHAAAGLGGGECKSQGGYPIDTDTTVHTLFGQQMGGRKSYDPKHRGKKSYQPILSFLAETREYVAGELRNGDRPSGKQIARHLDQVEAGLPKQVQTVYTRDELGFYCWEVV